MADYKKQHYLPSAYLKSFSTDQQNCNRSSSVWRYDGKASRCVPIVSQCFEDYFYSKEKAAETEKMLQVGEDAFCKAVDRIRSSKKVEDRSLGDVLLNIFDFHLRNAIHTNNTGGEGVEAYRRRTELFLSQILLGRTEGEISKADIVGHLTNRWRLAIISAPNDGEFVTSDHPALWLTLKKAVNGMTTQLHLVVLPLTPKHTAVGFDRRFFNIVDSVATLDDLKALNIAQIHNARNCVYMSRPLPDQEEATVRRWLAQKKPSVCEVDTKGWTLIWGYLPSQNYFSFVRLRPPLM